MKIRKAIEKDLNQIIELWKDYEVFERKISKKDYKFLPLRKDAEKNMLENFKRTIKKENSEIFLSEDNKKINGFILISKNKNDDIHNFEYLGSIHYLYVHPSERRKGIATKLFNTSKKWFKENKIKFINLYVNLNNKNAIKLYEKFKMDKYEISMWGGLK